MFVIYLFQVFTCRSLRNKCLNISDAARLMNSFCLVITYDITSILVILSETILFDGNESPPVILGSSDWHLWSGQEQDKWDSEPFPELTKVDNRTRFAFWFFCLYLILISLHYNYELLIIHFPQNYFNTYYYYYCLITNKK